MRKKLKKIKNFIGNFKIIQNVSSYISGNISVFCYHQVLKDSDFENISRPNNDLSISTSIFEQQIKFLKENYKIIEPKDLLEIKKFEKKDKLIVITFDDGYLDNLINALPILKKYQVKATIFVTTGFINDKNIPWWIELWNVLNSTQNFSLKSLDKDLSSINANKKKIYDLLSKKFFYLKTSSQSELMKEIKKENNYIEKKNKNRIFLNEEEIKLLSEIPLISLGAHTHMHENLNILNYNESEKEIKNSKNELENIINKSVDIFAYPYGRINTFGDKEIEILKESKFKLAFTTKFENYKNQSNYLIPRMSLGITNNNYSVRDKVNGLDSLINKIL
tara:strand:+ start:182 stop:1186 length:1005 start_codon:yes stop_codon:yes gene_type:complete